MLACDAKKRIVDKNGRASKAHRPKGIPVGIVVLRAVTAISVVVVPAAVSSSAATATAVASTTAAVSAAVRHDVSRSVVLG